MRHYKSEILFSKGLGLPGTQSPGHSVPGHSVATPDRTVPACRVIPYENSVEVVEVAINENVSDVLYDSSDDDSFTDPTLNIVTELRPKFYKNISFMVQ